MFDYQEPEASDNQSTNQEAGSLPLPPNSGPNDRGTRSLNPEKVRHMLYGSLAAIDRTIKILHALGYADPNDWSDPIPVPPNVETRSLSEAEMWMAILTKTILIE
ncbi:MAG: hypothetical protein WBG32_03295 [Nodosilinea sp.]